MAAGEIILDRGEPGVAVVALEGEHDAFTSRRLQEELTSALAEGLGVVVDLRPASFLDSTIVAVLLTAQKEAREREAGFALLMDESTGPYVRRLFEITSLKSVFAVFPTREEAVEGARSQSAGKPAPPSGEASPSSRRAGSSRRPRR